MNTNIRVYTTDKHLSGLGGLTLFAKCWLKFKLGVQVARFLPATRHTSKKFEDLALGFAAGAECLDDMNKLGRDEGFLAACDERVYTPKTYGDYLREFDSQQIEEGQKALARSAFIQRAALDKVVKSMTFDFDSTTNRQYAEVMEGVCFSGEKKVDCLTTMYVFDEKGHQYYSDVRPGNTHTSHSISKIIHMILSQMPKQGSYAGEDIYLPWEQSPYRRSTKIYARADAGYSNNEFFNACFAKGMGFVVRLHSNMLEPKIKNITNWKDIKNSRRKVKRRDGSEEYIDTSIRFYDGRSAEIGTTIYQNSDMAKSARIVCLRAKKPGRLGLQEDDYDYFAWLTNIDEHEMNNEKIIRFYRQRGHAENYIREMKNGYDMHHYPCLKLNANRAYALIAAYSHNILRFMALKSAGKKVHFAKAIRNKFIYLPCQVVRSAGQIIFKFMSDQAEEVNRFLDHLKTLQHGYT